MITFIQKIGLIIMQKIEKKDRIKIVRQASQTLLNNESYKKRFVIEQLFEISRLMSKNDSESKSETLLIYENEQAKIDERKTMMKIHEQQKEEDEKLQLILDDLTLNDLQL